VLLTPARTGFGGHLLLFVRIVVSLCFGIASYFLVERPIRTGARFPVRRLVVAAPIAAAACTIAILVSTTGATAPAGASAAAAFTSTPKSAQSTTAKAAAAGRHAPTTVPRLLIVGDSVGVNIGNAAEALDTGSGLVADNASIPGCLLAPSNQTFEATLNGRIQSIPSFNPCEAQWLGAAQAFKPKIVAIIYGTGGSFLDPLLDGQFVSACQQQYETWYQQHLSELIAQFMRLGASRVVLFKLAHVDNPNWPSDAAARIDCVNAVQAAVARSDRNVSMLDLAGVECPADKCITSYEGVPFRDDGIHVTVGAPAHLVGQWLLDETKRLLA
jgi:hypothetical protein